MTHCLKQRLMVVAGESGGHVFPAVGFCQGVKDKFDITFITTNLEKDAGWIPDEFRPEFLRIHKTVFGILELILRSFSLIWRLRPRIVVCFGGFITIPFVILARLSGAKVIIHEQNVIPGRANRFLSFFASKIAVSFEETKEFFKNNKKVFLTAYPLRSSLVRLDRQRAIDFFGLDLGLFTILVMGGSQGARSINTRFLESIKTNRNLGRFQVIHLSGKSDYNSVLSAYQALGLKSKVFDFLGEMNYAYSAADLVVSRSGAGSVFEIMSFGLASILVPYPFAGAHQAENARILSQKGAALILDDKNMSPVFINGLLDIFLEDNIRRKTMSAIASSIYGSSRNLKIEEVIAL